MKLLHGDVMIMCGIRRELEWTSSQDGADCSITLELKWVLVNVGSAVVVSNDDDGPVVGPII